MAKKSKTDSPVRRVAVLVDTSTDWGRRIISGIVRYVQEHERWQLFVEPAGIEEEVTFPRGWHGDGVIVRVNTADLAEQLKARKIPIVNVSGLQLGGPQFPRVSSDVGMVGSMAAEYLLNRGFKHFGYVSPRGFEPVVEQRDAFVTAVENAGCSCALQALASSSRLQYLDWNVNVERLGKWLAAQPKPLALLAWSGGRELVYACQHMGLSIPEEVAILSGCDDFLCEISQVPISAVRLACERIGYEAAAQLDRLMAGEKLEQEAILIPPASVITRQSTDTLAITDRPLLRALTYIRENAGKPIQVREAASRAGISRRVLERRFKKVLGSTPAEHIRRSHLERAKRLLTDTNLPMPDVAEASGFGSAAYMSYIFRSELKISPLRYRRESRGPKAES